eukprot:gene10817-14522_t
MSSIVANIDSQHEDMIHDCQFDYYSKKMATCSSDKSIKIFDVAGDIYHNSATLLGHDGPVWQVAWAHPKFGVLLASCSYDGTVLIHKETQTNNWGQVYKHQFHESSVNSISWASHEFGLVLACGSSDGRVSIIDYKNGGWSFKYFQNDSLGCNSVSWAPYSSSSSHSENGTLVRRLVTGSCDNIVRIWKNVDSDSSGQWTEEAKAVVTPHSDWVRDVAWAPNSTLPHSLIASCSEDKAVHIWKLSPKGLWEPTRLHLFEVPVWRVSWSITGNVLAVSSADHKVTLWKQSVDDQWIQISSVDD